VNYHPKQRLFQAINLRNVKKKPTHFCKNLVDVTTNRHIVKNLSRSTRVLLYLSIKTQLQYNEVLFDEFPGLFDKWNVVFLEPIPATFYEKSFFSETHVVMCLLLEKSFL